MALQGEAKLHMVQGVQPPAERDTAPLPTVQAEVLLLMALVPEETHPVPPERDRQRRHRQERPVRQSARRSIQSFACFLRYFFC